MPELPEVETIRLGLQNKIIGLTIKQVELLTPKSFQGNPKDITGKKIVGLWRRAKILGVVLESDFTMLIHLKMSGQLVYDSGKRPALPDGSRGRFIGGHPTPDMELQMPNRSTRVIFTFDDPLRPRSETSGSKLYFNDQRRFGWVKIVDSGQGIVDSLLNNLGPEPLEKEFTWQILRQNLLRHKTLPIKVALLDQSIVSGIGNIYASEACFNAKINPKTSISNLSDKQFKDLHKGILKALQDGIKHGGSTRTNFVDSEGRRGYFLDYAFVYWRDKEPCRVCNTTIEKIQLRGRGTYYCPSCQK